MSLNVADLLDKRMVLIIPPKETPQTRLVHVFDGSKTITFHAILSALPEGADLARVIHAAKLRRCRDVPCMTAANWPYAYVNREFYKFLDAMPMNHNAMRIFGTPVFGTLVFSRNSVHQ